jgi:hypothetical protein
VILIETAAITDLESLRDLAFASAHNPGITRTNHWDETRRTDTAFYFEDYEAAFTFINHCAVLGIPFKPQWPKISN